MLIIFIIGIGKEKKKMNVKELTSEQLQQLKVNYLDNLLQEEENRNISYNEIAQIDLLVSNELIFKLYQNYTFTDEDFF